MQLQRMCGFAVHQNATQAAVLFLQQLDSYSCSGAAVRHTQVSTKWTATVTAVMPHPWGHTLHPCMTASPAALP